MRWKQMKKDLTGIQPSWRSWEKLEENDEAHQEGDSAELQNLGRKIEGERKKDLTDIQPSWRS